MKLSYFLLLVPLQGLCEAEANSRNNCQTITSNCETVTVKQLPESIEDFQKLRRTLGSSPEGAASLLLLALMQRYQDRTVGSHMLIFALHPDLLEQSGVSAAWKGWSPNRSTQYLLRQIDKKSACIDHYLYDQQFRFRRQDRYVGERSTGRYKVFICTPLASTCRPITTERTAKGWWKIREFSTLATGCQLPNLNHPADF